MRTAPPRRRCSRANGAPSGWARSPPGMPPSRTCARSPRRSRSSPARPSARRPRVAQRRGRLSCGRNPAPPGGRASRGAAGPHRARHAAAAAARLSAPWRPRALDRRAGSREPAHAREGRARRRRDPVRERGGEAHRARVTADGHLRRDLRHLRELRGAMAEPSRGGGARRRGAPGLEGAACAREPPRPRGLRLSVLRGRAARGARGLRRGEAGGLPGLPCRAPGRGRHRRRSQAAARRRAHVSDGRRGAPRALAPENARGPHGGRDVLGKGGGMKKGIEQLATTWQSLPDYARSTAWILVITVALIISVALLMLWERKVIGWMQLRRGPNRVRLFGVAPGLGQPFADVLKLLLKEVVVPANSDKFLFRLAPVLALVPALAAWAVIPLSPEVVVSKADAGLLYLLSLTSMGVYGVIVAGWAANSKYAFLGAMRSAAQMVAYEIAMGFALVGVLMATGSMNLGTIVRTQAGGIGSWNWFWLFPLLMVYFISGVAETNRAPFDVAEGESEIVAGFHVEYSGIAFALFFLAEY